MRPARPLHPLALALVAAGLVGLGVGGSSCAPPVAADGPVALYDTSESRADFFALPWPSDARTVGSGAARTLDLAGFRDPGGVIAEYLRLLGSEPLGGFGTSSGIFFRFDGPLDPESLPRTVADSVLEGASAFVVDVTPGSPTAGRRAPLRIAFLAEAGDYLGSNALVLLPAPGYPLRPATTYAAIVTDGVRGAGLGAVRRDERFTLPALPLSVGVAPERIACATVFTTMDPTWGMRALREAVYASVPAPTLDPADPRSPGTLRYVGLDATRTFDRYEGTFTAPVFQQGDPPYLRTGGGILFTGGKPQIARTESLRFALTVPRANVPASGFPIVLYAHGTGGDYQSFIEDGSAWRAASVSDDAGNTIARMAMISIDQPLHGPRDPIASDPQITTYNIQNLPAARDVFRQGAADDFQLLRLVKSIDVPSAPGTQRPLRFDPARIYFKGHSQGGTTGPLFLAFEPDVKAAVLSGAGANLIESLLHKSEPRNIPQIVEALVGEEVTAFHPLMSLLQTYLEPADPGNYARHFFLEPPPGQAPKSVYQSLGLVDHFTPVSTIAALGFAAGLVRAAPELRTLEALGVEAPVRMLPLDPPLESNVANGSATGVTCQYQVPDGASGKPLYDGHFVVFQHPVAARQANRFLARHAQGGVARLEP